MRLLLDEHVSEEDTVQIRHHHPEIDVTSLHTWEGGAYHAQSDQAILSARNCSHNPRLVR